jgi:AbrB family looped-hinge helix DNA binding protein
MGYEVTVAANGRLVIPLELRKQLGIEHGGTLFLEADDEELRLRSRLQGLKRAQRLSREMLAGTPAEHESAVDWLLNERRRASEQEDRELDSK